MSIESRGLCFSYGPKQVLHDLDLQFDRGRVVALLGENGSGKSTLLSCLAGLRGSPDVFWDGRPVNGRSLLEQALQRALVPQHPSFDPTMVLYDYVLLGRKPHFRWKDGPKDHEVVANMLESFGLSPLAFRRLSEISGGERQKAVLARAFVQDTPLLFLDEPLNNLDLRFQIEFLTAVRNRVAESGVLVISALHDINTALGWCDEALLLKGGRLVACGPLDQTVTEESLEQTLGVRTVITKIAGRRQMVVPTADKVSSEE